MFLRNFVALSGQYLQYTIKNCHVKNGVIIESYSFILINTNDI